MVLPMPEERPCQGCGALLTREMFSDVFMFRRSKFCSQVCWVESRRTSSVIRDCSGIVLLLLANGIISLISEQDAAFVAEHSWFLDEGGYVSSPTGRLHRVLLLNPDGFQVDHKNGNKLDNRRENLRAVPAIVNSRNRHRARRDSKTGVFGVGWDSARKQYVAEIKVHGKRKRWLGRFSTIEEATRARRAAEDELWGDLR